MPLQNGGERYRKGEKVLIVVYEAHGAVVASHRDYTSLIGEPSQNRGKVLRVIGKSQRGSLPFVTPHDPQHYLCRCWNDITAFVSETLAMLLFRKINT